MSPSKIALAVLAGAATVAAHGHVDDIVVEGVYYEGYDVTTLPYMSDPPTVVGWSTTATDNGFVAPDAFADADIICHRGAENAGGYAEVAAGSDIMFEWTDWPESHHGPVIDYIAACGDSCSTVDKTTLEFVKIGEVGLLDGSTAPGTWASDTLIDNGSRWIVKIPSTLAPGEYVVRHEIIALHSAGNEDGAQNYPQCVSIKVTGDGTESPEGTLGTELYTADEDGILFNIYTSMSTYPIPGPTLWSGAESATQSIMEIDATSSATTDGAIATGDSTTSTSAAAETTSTTAAAETTTTAAAEEETTSSSSTTAAAVETSTTAAEISTTAPLETVTTAAPEATETPATEEPEVVTTTKHVCNSSKRKHRRHAREMI